MDPRTSNPVPSEPTREQQLEAQLSKLQKAYRDLMEQHGGLCIEYGTRLQQLAKAGVLLT